MFRTQIQSAQSNCKHFKQNMSSSEILLHYEVPYSEHDEFFFLETLERRLHPARYR